MPPKYKYAFMPDGRMKALGMAYERYSDLYKLLSKSGIIDPATLENMRVIQVLLRRASIGYGGSSEDNKLLEELLGPNMGTTYRD
jgi:hypothetical protein